MPTKNLIHLCSESPLSRENRIHAGWLGKSIGGTLGLPAEGRMEQLNYSFYDPVPTSAPPNDDLELQLVWLDLVENSGSSLSQSDFARAWLDHIHYMWDEYGRCRWNLRRGVPIELVGTFENPFHAGMGSPIRSEIWACLFPEDPDSAAHYAALDASLDHGVEGIAGEVFFAVLQNKALSGASLSEAIDFAISYVPGACETQKALAAVRRDHAEGLPAWPCWQRLLDSCGHENFTHAPLNVALTIWALLYGDGDFEKSILLAVNGGYDTDCTAATVGATLGLAFGKDSIPERWSRPIGEEVYIGPGIIGISAPKTLTELTSRTLALIGKLEARKWRGLPPGASTQSPALASLPGTVSLDHAPGMPPVHWANGELPTEVKRAGSATWTWEVSAKESREIICLARAGAKLFVDGQLVVECPPNLPYVPATHRSPEGSRISLSVEAGLHSVRVELNSRSEDQEASVILAYPNLHICPWTRTELPAAANLAPSPAIPALSEQA